jgi:predicted DNA-binding transcriptional regulator AlpA
MSTVIDEQECVLVSCKTLAKMLSISPRTAWRLRSAGKLPKTVSVGSSIRWRLSDINLFLQCNCNMAEFEARKKVKKC